MALDDAVLTVGMLLRQCMQELAAAYELAVHEHGEDSVQAIMLADALTFMRGWMRRYSAHAEARGSGPP